MKKHGPAYPASEIVSAVAECTKELAPLGLKPFLWQAELEFLEANYAGFKKANFASKTGQSGK